MANTHQNNKLSIMERVLRLRQYMVSMPTPLPDNVLNNNPPAKQSALQTHSDASPKELPARVDWDDWDDCGGWGKWK